MKFSTLQQLTALCTKRNQRISEVMIEAQAHEEGRSEEQVFERMLAYYQIMKEAVTKGLTEDTTSLSGFTGNDAKKVMSWLERDEPSAGTHAVRAMAYALSVSEINASMGRIIATPTAGSCGILPGVLVSSQERFGWDDRRMTEGLFTAGAIGYVIANNSFISGAEGGCQAEVGSAIGMAAGAMVELRGGTPEMAMHAVGLALKNTLGLICDPVGGLVEVPCIVRNGFGAVNALAAADMALAGMKSTIPSDEVIGVMHEVGSDMHEKYRETAKGGLARTPTGKKLLRQFYRRKG